MSTMTASVTRLVDGRPALVVRGEMNGISGLYVVPFTVHKPNNLSRRTRELLRMPNPPNDPVQQALDGVVVQKQKQTSPSVAAAHKLGVGKPLIVYDPCENIATPSSGHESAPTQNDVSVRLKVKPPTTENSLPAKSVDKSPIPEPQNTPKVTQAVTEDRRPKAFACFVCRFRTNLENQHTVHLSDHVREESLSGCLFLHDQLNKWALEHFPVLTRRSPVCQLCPPSLGAVHLDLPNMKAHAAHKHNQIHIDRCFPPCVSEEPVAFEPVQEEAEPEPVEADEVQPEPEEDEDDEVQAEPEEELPVLTEEEAKQALQTLKSSAELSRKRPHSSAFLDEEDEDENLELLASSRIRSLTGTNRMTRASLKAGEEDEKDFLTFIEARDAWKAVGAIVKELKLLRKKSSLHRKTPSRRKYTKFGNMRKESRKDTKLEMELASTCLGYEYEMEF